jgi:hypothetical protein
MELRFAVEFFQNTRKYLNGLSRPTDGSWLGKHDQPTTSLLNTIPMANGCNSYEANTGLAFGEENAHRCGNDTLKK